MQGLSTEQGTSHTRVTDDGVLQCYMAYIYIDLNGVNNDNVKKSWTTVNVNKNFRYFYVAILSFQRQCDLNMNSQFTCVLSATQNTWSSAKQ